MGSKGASQPRLDREQAIGKPEGHDSIQKGKEKLMEAWFNGAKGQAFNWTPMGDHQAVRPRSPT